DNNRTCEECHMNDWGDAARAPDWTDKSAMDLCRGMHVVFEHDAPRFIDHMLRDGGNVAFIEAAFVGKRGLSEGGQTIYEGETGQPFSAAPPPGTHGQLVQQARDWVAAQGGQFVGDRDCGCVVDKLEVLFHSTMTVVDHGPAKETSTITGEGSLVLKLGPELSAPDWNVATGVHGETTKIAWSGVGVTRSDGCQVIIQSSPATEFKFWLGMSYTPSPKLSLEIVPSIDTHANIKRCPHPVTGAMVGAKADPIPHMFMAAWTALHAKGAAAVPVDFTKLQAMDPKALAAMAEAMKNNPSPAQMKELMNRMVPNASQAAAAMKNNYRFALPDDKWCKLGTGTAFLAQCDISQTVTVPGTMGAGQTITETTTITIGRPQPAQL
ncbi:MAG: hypothetical protein M3Q75_15520, partial [Gemmatimonadota bacterium]|nr:hypothetical protein [Gemmatimonadota bacterium]